MQIFAHIVRCTHPALLLTISRLENHIMASYLSASIDLSIGVVPPVEGARVDIRKLHSSYTIGYGPEGYSASLYTHRLCIHSFTLPRLSGLMSPFNRTYSLYVESDASVMLEPLYLMDMTELFSNLPLFVSCTPKHTVLQNRSNQETREQVRGDSSKTIST